MAAPVRIEAEALSDPRIELLGQLAGYNRFEALGRLTHLWAACTAKQLYIATEPLVRACIGPAGVQHMLDAELAERTDGGLRVKGTDGRIEWFGELSSKRQHAGRERAAKALRDERGRLLPHNSPAHAGHAGPSTSSGPPAQSSAPTPTPTPTQRDPDLSGKPDPASLFAEAAVSEINRIAGTSFEHDSKSAITLARTLVKAKHTEAEALAVIRSKREWVSKPDMRQHFCPSTLLGPKNFQRYLDDLKGRANAPATRFQAIPSRLAEESP